MFQQNTLYKVSFTATKLVHSYLEGRSQAVYANGVYSSMLRVKAGVPLGSVLGFFIFSIYTNDLSKIIKTCNIHMYADDVQLYTSFEMLPYCMVQTSWLRTKPVTVVVN